VTELALVTHRSPDLRLPRLLAGVSYYSVAGLRDHEQQYGPLPLWGTSGRRRPGRLIDVVAVPGFPPAARCARWRRDQAPPW
jgi:hypothetical protein